MRLVNDTPHQALLLPFRQVDAEVACVAIVKATYDIEPSGALAPAAEQVPILGEGLVTPFGQLHGECFPAKQGADVCVLGTVRRERPVPSVTLRLEVGAFAHELRVTGDRRWGRRAAGHAIEPSEPEPFTDMPVAYTRAFGGSAEQHGLVAAWPDNPLGVGFYLTEEQAAGQRLPNVEPAVGPRIAAWNDRPVVAGWGPYPAFWGLRAREGIEIDTSSDAPRIKRLRPSLHNHAHPALVLPGLAPGAPVSIEGLEASALRFRLPARVAVLRVSAGAAEQDVALACDGAFIWTDTRKVVLTHRAVFHYTCRRYQTRRARLAFARAA